ncbi:hypothetical protein [Kitasatospora phosalacinea]|nr:hypothetical protein [Kitasatospora phosalacinea]
MADQMLGKLLREETAEADGSAGCLRYTGTEGCSAGGWRCRYAWYSWNCAAQPQLVCAEYSVRC